MMAIGAILYVVFLVLMIYCYVRIVQRAGFSGWWVLILLVPLVNLVMMFVFAYGKWPVIEKGRVNPSVFN